MRGIYIIVEGQTEFEFVHSALRPHFRTANINDVRAILLETSPGHKGGDLKFERYKTNIIRLLKKESDIIVTSLIDFFRLRNDFPKFEEAKTIQDKNERVTFLENAINGEINNHRFIPYIQLHEFEGLLFSAKKGFEYIEKVPVTNLQKIEETIKLYPNPELLNDGSDTAPSKRLEKLIPGYRKTLHGPIIALENGLSVTLQKCPRFNNWVNLLIEKSIA